MALRAIARRPVDGNGVGVAHHALRIQMLAARSMAVFALDVGQILHRRRHGGPIAVGQNRREGPAVLPRHIIKAAVDGKGIGVITSHMAGDAARTIMAALQTINRQGEKRGVRRVGIAVENARRSRKLAAMTGGAGLETKIGGRSNRDGQIGRTAAHRGDGGVHGVWPHGVRAEKGATRQLIRRCRALARITIRGVVERHVVAERRGRQRGQ